MLNDTSTKKKTGRPPLGHTSFKIYAPPAAMREYKAYLKRIRQVHHLSSMSAAATLLLEEAAKNDFLVAHNTGA